MGAKHQFKIWDNVIPIFCTWHQNNEPITSIKKRSQCNKIKENGSYIRYDEEATSGVWNIVKQPLPSSERSRYPTKPSNSCVRERRLDTRLVQFAAITPLDVMRLLNWREIATGLSSWKIGDIVNIHPKPAVHVATTNNELTAPIDLCIVVLSDILLLNSPIFKILKCLLKVPISNLYLLLYTRKIILLTFVIERIFKFLQR